MPDSNQHSVPTDFEIVAEALDPWLRIEGRGEAIKALARIEEQFKAACEALECIGDEFHRIVAAREDSSPAKRQSS